MREISYTGPLPLLESRFWHSPVHNTRTTFNRRTNHHKSHCAQKWHSTLFRVYFLLSRLGIIGKHHYTVQAARGAYEEESGSWFGEG